MGLGVRQAERAAEDVAQPVVQAHADGAEAGARQPGGLQRVRPCFEIGGVLGDPGRAADISAIARSASSSVTGLACGAYSASTAWAMALTPLVTDTAPAGPG